MSEEVDIAPDSGEVSVGRAIDAPTHPAPETMPPEGEAAAPVMSSPKRRTRLVVLIVVGLLIVAGSWWATSALLGLLNPTATGEAAQEGGYTYSSGEVGYEIIFPGVPDVTSSSVPVGDLDIEQTTATWSNESVVYSVTTAELPVDIVAAAGDAILEGSVDGMLANLPGAELREKAEGSLDGERALSGVMAADGSDIWFTVAMHGNTQAILTVTVPTGEAALEFAETFRFLD